MFTSRAELLDKEETTAEHLKNHQEESERLDKDKTNTNPHNGGLFAGMFRPKPPPLKPLVDVDDGVVRCPHCGWELENDQTCAGCGYEYRPESSDTDYSDDFSDTDDYDSMLDEEEAEEEDDFGDMEDDESAWGPYGIHQEGNPTSLLGHLGALMDHPYHHPPYRHPHPYPHFHIHPHSYRSWTYTQPMAGISHPNEDEDEEEEAEDEYEMDSFIDDEEHEREHGEGYVSDSDHSTVVGGIRPGNRTSPIPDGPPSVSYPSVFVGDDSAREMIEDSVDEDNSTIPSQPWEMSSSSQEYHNVRSSSTCTDNDEEAEDSDEPHTGRGRVYYQPSSISPPPNEESSPPQRPTRSSRNTGVSARHAITIDDSDDEQPVGPMRRQRRQARFSPY